MKRLGIFVCILLIISLIGCGGGADEVDNNISKDRVSPQHQARDKAGEPAPEKPKGPAQGWIKKISFSKKLQKGGTALIFKVETTKPLAENQYLFYIYWINQEKFLETPQDTLPPTAYKKGDLVFVDVALYQEGQILEQRRSELLQIENSSPVIKEVKIPEIDGPGLYRIIVKAQDPDGDEITYSVAGNPLPEGLEINPQTGVVTYVLGEKAPPEKIKFTITADDGDKGITKKTVAITFNITRPAENQERRKS
jgi:hypothetical protein